MLLRTPLLISLSSILNSVVGGTGVGIYYGLNKTKKSGKKTFTFSQTLDSSGKPNLAQQQKQESATTLFAQSEFNQ